MKAKVALTSPEDSGVGGGVGGVMQVRGTIKNVKVDVEIVHDSYSELSPKR